MTPLLEDFLARTVEARPTAAPPYRARLLAPIGREGQALQPSTRPAAAVSRARESAPPAPPVSRRKPADLQTAALAAKPPPQRAEGRTPETESESLAAPSASVTPVANPSWPDPTAPESVASETLVVETRASPRAAETVGRVLEAAVARIVGPDPPTAAAPTPVAAPSVVTSIVIGRVELTAAPAAAPQRAASSSKAPMSLDEYLSRRGQVGR